MFVKGIARFRAMHCTRVRLASTLVLAEHTNTALVGGTLNAITAARKLGDVTVLVVGSGSAKAASEAASIDGVSRVLHADNAAFTGGMAESVTQVVISVQEKLKFNSILAAANNYGKNILPRLAAKLDVAAISDITAVIDGATFERPMYAGNSIAQVRSHDAVKVMTVRPTSFEKAGPRTGAAAPIEAVSSATYADKSRLVSEEHLKSERPELASAPVIVSGGRAMKSADNFNMLYALADKMGAAVGASRAAVDAGYAPNDLQIGQTGKVVAPKLYVAVGISGAIQHLAGMKDSKVIVAINKDPDAPIMQVSDYALVEDLFKAVPELTQKLPAAK